ncbi:MAG: beta-lactamase family protein [Eubacteriaceae bacterium]|jgi:CubicO group peptidase (beta-lactamase class C family)|nr:beta-lactamase family protein [Eubacteriaceae bacterium]
MLVTQLCERWQLLVQSKGRKRALTIICIGIAVAAVGIGGFFAFAAYQINQIPKMKFEDMLTYTTKNNKKALVAVGIIHNGEASYSLYGENGTALPQANHIYEIGSITKTFTASLLFKAVSEGKISLSDSIDKYLDLPIKDYYPTIRRIVTHTSGYKGYYFETQMVSNFFYGRNDFYGISKTQLLERNGKIDLEDRGYNFCYSNFGFAAVGAVLSEIYELDYPTMINNYITEEFGLRNTKISDGSGDLENYWDWAKNDAYMPAGALASTIEDMLKYAQLQINEKPEYLSDTHKALAEANAASASNAKMNIRMDSMGAAWIIDAENNIIWHNGGTDGYNCYLGFALNKQAAVVVLSNLSPGYRIPATVMGVKLLTDLQ